MKDNIYVGLENDDWGGMTPIGNVIRDAWLFGILPESQTCENWTMGQIQAIHQQVMAEWDKYGCVPSGLPDDLKKRHAEYSDAAVKRARDLGWDPEVPPNDD